LLCSFFANEGHEPVHVHVRKAGGFAKFWEEPVELEYARRMKTQEIARAEELIREYRDLILQRWNEVFNR
jgi:hypothetical protein